MSARTPTAPVMKPETARRYWILTVMFLATFVNYLDRATLAVVGPTIQTEFGISDVAFGWLSSAFIWAITITIVFFGLLMQRFGERLIGAIGLAGFSLATIFSGFAGGFGSLLAMRVTLASSRLRLSPSTRHSCVGGSPSANVPSRSPFIKSEPAWARPWAFHSWATSPSWEAGGRHSSSLVGSAL